MSKKPVLPKTFPVACHTDHIGPGSAFVAIKGMKEDGINYIPLAIQKGARKIVIPSDVKLDQKITQQLKKHNIQLVQSKNPRQTLAQLSAQALNYPSKNLKIIGVTGTKGKTTTCFLVEHLLHAAGYKTALLSTVHNKINKTIFNTDLTTQHPDYLHIFFDQCVKNNIEFVVMEVAAQALSLERICGIEFDGVIFTNFDQEHAEFYDSMDNYFAAKCKIFEQAKMHAPILVNADNTWCEKILKNMCSFSLKNKHVDYHAQILKNDISGLQLTINNKMFSCPALFGEFNAYNILVSVALLKKLEISSKKIQQSLQTFCGVPGRLQIHELPNGARACIDKAHNPSSYQAILSTLRPMTDHLIVVFGCGGERDKTKRPVMGAIAAKFCDRVILTSDDPRSEDPEEIIKNILEGIDAAHQAKVVKEIDREAAIKFAYKLSQSTSIIALLGKGPEEYQLINGAKQYLSERQILEALT